MCGALTDNLNTNRETVVFTARNLGSKQLASLILR